MAENVPALKRQASSNYKQSSTETHIQAYSTEMAIQGKEKIIKEEKTD